MKFKTIILEIIMITCFTCFSFIFASTDFNINSQAAISMDADTGMILYGKNIDKKIYPASTTKILTAILALENLDLNTNIVVSKQAIQIPWDSSSVYLKEGEILSVEELLYCLLLNSGNDAANVLAEAVSGNISSFVNMMNSKAIEIGCTNTHFNNAHGYSDDNHYTTALDMAKIFNYCIKNETFVKIISTKTYVVNETNKTNEKRYLSNTNRLIQTKQDNVHGRYYEYCIGGKTGYTDEAGRTLVTFGTKDDITVIVAIFGASASGTQDIRYTDAINLFEHSFNDFEKKLIADNESFKYSYINLNKELSYDLGLISDIEILCPKNSSLKNVSYSINIDDTTLVDISENNFKPGITVGKLIFNVTTSDDKDYTFENDLCLTNVSKYKIIKFSSIFIIAIIIILVLVIICCILLLIVILKKKKIRHHDDSGNSRKDRRY